MGRDNELTIEAVRRAHSAPGEVTADRLLLVGLILGPILLVIGLTASGALDAAQRLRAKLDAPPPCGSFCPEKVAEVAPPAGDRLPAALRLDGIRPAPPPGGVTPPTAGGMPPTE